MDRIPVAQPLDGLEVGLEVLTLSSYRPHQANYQVIAWFINGYKTVYQLLRWTAANNQNAAPCNSTT